MRKLTFVLGLAFFVSTATQCEEDTVECPEGVTAEFVDLTGLDGCSWVLELEDGTRLEPVNLSDFDLTPEADRPVSVSYTEVEVATICMAGLVVELECLEYK
jgi:hypothetical protein